VSLLPPLGDEDLPPCPPLVLTEGTACRYLGFLYFLGRPEARTPPVVNWGFRFLLLFVAATIPAGVIGKWLSELLACRR